MLRPVTVIDHWPASPTSYCCSDKLTFTAWFDFTGSPLANISGDVNDSLSAEGWLIMARTMTLDFQIRLHVSDVFATIAFM